jgi:hypothetical protein
MLNRVSAKSRTREVFRSPSKPGVKSSRRKPAGREWAASWMTWSSHHCLTKKCRITGHRERQATRISPDLMWKGARRFHQVGEGKVVRYIQCGRLAMTDFGRYRPQSVRAQPHALRPFVLAQNEQIPLGHRNIMQLTGRPFQTERGRSKSAALRQRCGCRSTFPVQGTPSFGSAFQKTRRT